MKIHYAFVLMLAASGAQAVPAVQKPANPAPATIINERRESSIYMERFLKVLTPKGDATNIRVGKNKK